MSSALIAIGVAFVPCILLALALLVAADPERRGSIVRHPIRSIAEAMRSDDEED